jgi:hypothetical protein
MESHLYEAAPHGDTPENAYEQNHALLLELMGRINGRLATKRRTDMPRGWEHIGEQEEIMAMLQSVADYLEA